MTLNTHIKTGIIVLVVLLFTGLDFASAQTASETEVIVEKIRKAEKVEQLYSARYNLEKISNRPDLPVAEMRKVLDAHLLLTNEFKARNHFRNAVDVYMDYLKLSEAFHKKYSSFLADSMQKVNNADALSYKNKIEKLDAEISTLTERNVKVSGLRNKYLTVGGLTAAVILVIFTVILLSRNKAIRETNLQIENSNQAVMNIYRDVVNATVLSGTVHYARHLMNENAALADQLLVSLSNPDNQKTNATALKALQDAQNIFGQKS